MSPQHENPPAATSPFEMPSPLGSDITGRWKPGSVVDDGYSGIGMDYFGGPDLTGTSPGAVSPSIASQFARQAPSVQTPPVQPKWRQQAQPVDVAGSAPSSSSSSSSLNGILSPQPGRSILKVRSSATSVPVPEPVSPPAIFNYNPSVATGIGGMYGSYEEARLVIGSPTTAASGIEDRGAISGVAAAAAGGGGGGGAERGREQRGRSTSRGYGSSQNDRAAAAVNRASSTSSSSSMSRSPVEQQPVKARRESQDKQVDTTGGEPMDVDYQPERSSTPTPHSSPQVSGHLLSLIHI